MLHIQNKVPQRLSKDLPRNRKIMKKKSLEEIKQRQREREREYGK
jgi:hypothetical protein